MRNWYGFDLMNAGTSLEKEGFQCQGGLVHFNCNIMLCFWKNAL